MTTDSATTDGVPADVVGREHGPWTRTWTADDALLYALGVGAGQQDPTVELALTTENTAGVDQQVLPTYAVVLAQFGGPPLGLDGVERSRVLHAEQAVTLHRPLPVAGTVELRRTITDLFDKGSGALLLSRTTAVDPTDRQPVFTTRSALFVRGAGGFGGDRGPSEAFAVPDRPADLTVRFATAPNQALLYRLSGDRNPLHSDPAVAARGGFPRPILHGMATYGITVRLLAGATCAGDHSRVVGVSGRFTRPVLPGDELVVSGWRVDETTVLFRTANGAGQVVLDRGTLHLRPATG